MIRQDRIPLEEKDIAIVKDPNLHAKVQINQAVMMYSQATELKQQILDDAKKAELYDKLEKYQGVFHPDLKTLVEKYEQNSKIVDEIRKLIENESDDVWCEPCCIGHNHDLSGVRYKLQSILEGKT